MSQEGEGGIYFISRFTRIKATVAPPGQSSQFLSSDITSWEDCEVYSTDPLQDSKVIKNTALALHYYTKER